MFCCYLLQTHSCCCYFYLLSPLLLRLFTSCISEASQKEDERRSRTPGRRLGNPRRAEAPWPASSLAPGVVPSQRHVPPARGMAAPGAGSSSALGITLAPGWTDMKSRSGVEAQQSLSHLLPSASRGLSPPLLPNLWPDAFLRPDEPVPLGCSPVPSAASSCQGQLPVPSLNLWLVMRRKIPIGLMWWATKSTPHHGDGANGVSCCSPTTGIC